MRWIIKTLYIDGEVLYQNKLQRLDILTVDGKISKLGKSMHHDDDFKIVDCKGKLVLPALIDIHIHGANGHDFNTADTSGMQAILDFCAENGVGSIFPTILTDDENVMLAQLKKVARLAKKNAMIKGIHLEGPFLSEKYKGAMPAEFLQPICMKKFLAFQRAAGGLIKLVTISPELSGAADFVTQLKEQGVVVSLGHSDATFDAAMNCIACGAKSFTHTFNAMRLCSQREPAIMGAALVSDGFCEIIADGKHVHEVMIKLLIKTKGVDKIIAITDSIMATGMPDGNYHLGAKQVTVKNGDAFVTGTNTRAGSTLTASQAFRNIITYGGLTLAQAAKAVSENPAKLLGIFDSVGSIEVGKNADFYIFPHDSI